MRNTMAVTFSSAIASSTNTSRFQPLVAGRVLDTRTGGSPVAAGSTTVLDFSEVDAGHSVVLNVAAVDPTGDGYVTVYPCGMDRPLVASVNYMSGVTHSNQATVRLGMDVQPKRLAELIHTLAGIQSEGQPSLILGAVDQSPYAMAQLYQFLASDGEIQPLHAVRGVLEVETPMLSAAGNTDPNIESFVTTFDGHVDAGARQRWLRTSPEFPGGQSWPMTMLSRISGSCSTWR